MKSIADVTLSYIERARETKSDHLQLDPLCAQLVDKLFVKMALICRGFDAFYADRNRLNAEKTQWTIAFAKLGLRNQSQIQLALDRLELYRFPNPPQLGEFLEWRNANPKDIGFPSAVDAHSISILMNAQFSEYKHEDERVDSIIRHVIGQIGSFVYRAMSVAESKKTFQTYYDICIRDFMNGNLKEVNKMMAHKSDLPDEKKKQADVVLEPYKGMSRNEALETMKKLLQAK